MRLPITSAAQADLREIRDYTLHRWGPEQEERYLFDLWDRFESIQSDPSVYRSREDLFPGCQIATQAKHVVLFRTGDDVLEIVRILHAAMDFKRHIE